MRFPERYKSLYEVDATVLAVPNTGSDIKQVAQDIARVASDFGKPVKFTFCGVDVIVSPGQKQEEIVDLYWLTRSLTFAEQE